MDNILPVAIEKIPLEAPRQAPLLIYAKLIFVAFCWGGTFPAARIVSQALPYLRFIPAAGRCAIACMLLLILVRKLESGLPRLNRLQFLVTFALGFTGFFLNVVFLFAAMSHIPAGRAALIITLNPIVTALALALLFRERLGVLKWVGIAIAFAGAAVIITRGDLLNALSDLSVSIGVGELLMFSAIFCWAVYAIIGQYALKGLSPIAATTYSALWGFLLLACASAFEWHTLNISHFTWQVILSIVYQGTFGTVIAFVWYYEGVKTIGPSRTAIFNNLVPVFGIALAAILLHEPVLLSMIIGGALVIVGVFLTNR
jgi:drug/metabolite transporter (DMT)-like permease